jgi:hypothetical protein
VPVPDTFISLVEQLVPWNIVGLDVFLYLVEFPGKQGVELDEASRIDLKRLQRRTVGTLGRTATSDDCANVQCLVRALRRFGLQSGSEPVLHHPTRSTDLDRKVVRVLVTLPRALSELALKVCDGIASLGLEHVHLDSVPLLDLCNECVRLRKVIEGIDEDERGLVRGRGCDLGEHVNGDEAR